MTYLADKTYWKIGGNCDFYYEVESIDELIATLELIKKLGKSYVVIGNGTNILFDTSGFENAVIKLGRSFDYLNISGREVEVGASVWVPSLVRKLSKVGMGGLEHCIGIPATLGGLVSMNGGSQRQSISERLVSVKYINGDGKIINWEADPTEFSYRASPFKNNSRVIISCTIRVDEISPNQNRKKLLEILRERRLKFPRKLPNCGSVFMSSPEIYKKKGPPGYIIESLGLKGTKIGNAQISELHANFIVNLGGATSEDVIQLVKLINYRCYKEYGFIMHAEAIFYSKTGDSFSLSDIK